MSRWMDLEPISRRISCGTTMGLKLRVSLMSDFNVFWLVVWNIFYFPIYIGNNNPNWLIFFRGVETINQYFNHHLPCFSKTWWFFSGLTTVCPSQKSTSWKRCHSLICSMDFLQTSWKALQVTGSLRRPKSEGLRCWPAIAAGLDQVGE